MLSSEVVRPDSDKVIAIESMKPPKDKSELEAFVGMLTYLPKYAPNKPSEL